MPKKSLLSFSIVTLLVLIGLYLFYTMEYNFLLKEKLNDGKEHLKIESERFKLSLMEVESDTRYLREKLQTNLLTNPHALEEDFFYFMAEKKRYDQIRFLDTSGMEKIRLNYNAGHPYVVDETQLQNKAARYYFQEAINLAKGSIYQSPLDLNIEFGVIEIPLKPMIRFSTPVYTKDGIKRGLLVLNYLAEASLKSIQQSPDTLTDTLFLLNHKGYYLSGVDNEKLWGFMFKDKEDITFAKEYPDIWNQMVQSSANTLTNESSVFLYNTITLPQQSKDALNCDYCRWYVVAEINKRAISDLVFDKILLLAPMIVSVYALFLLLFYFLLRTKELRQKQTLEINKLHQSIADERDLFVSGPTIVFKLKNTQGWPVEYVSSNIKELLGFTPEAFTQGDFNFASILAPEYIQTFSAKISAIEKEGIDVFEHDTYEIVDKQGHYHWVRDNMKISRNAQGNIEYIYGYINDISALMEAEQKLRENNKYIQTVLDTIADPTIVINISDYEVVFCNEAARSLYADTTQLSSYGKCYQMTHLLDTTCNGHDSTCPIDMLLKRKKTTRVTHRHISKEGRPFYVEVAATPIFDAKGTIVQIIESHHDITHHVTDKAELKTLAQTDTLTGTFNRSKFDELLDDFITQAKGNTHYFGSIGLIMFDIDHFKKINDAYGHDVGDSVLVELTQLIKKRIRKDDLLVRWGGEEFIVLIPNSELNILHTIAENLRKSVQLHPLKHVGILTCSFGVSDLQKHDTKQTILKRVDEALYASKEAGRNRVTCI
jgi:diguanylate cyclase (GGDEF)-like protein/PAS domain S-box-containing protein